MISPPRNRLSSDKRDDEARSSEEKDGLVCRYGSFKHRSKVILEAIPGLQKACNVPSCPCWWVAIYYNSLLLRMYWGYLQPARLFPLFQDMTLAKSAVPSSLV